MNKGVNDLYRCLCTHGSALKENDVYFSRYTI